MQNTLALHPDIPASTDPAFRAVASFLTSLGYSEEHIPDLAVIARLTPGNHSALARAMVTIREASQPCPA